MVEELCQRLDIKCNVRFLPWKRVLLETKIGKIDGGFGAFKTPEREEFAYFLEYPLHYSTYSVFVKKGQEFRYEKLDDLYGKKIGINRGFKLSKDFDEAATTKKIHVEEAGDMTANITKLMEDRISATVGNYHETLFTLKEMKLSDQVVSLNPPVVPPKEAYLMISKVANIPNKLSLIEKMNRILKTMYDDGAVDHISSNYLK